MRTAIERRRSYRRSILMSASAMLCAACSYTPAGQAISGTTVGGVGGIRENYVPLSGGSHMVTVMVQPGLLETETSMSDRVTVHAAKFASEKCPGGFDFQNAAQDQPALPGLAQRTRTFIFRCR